MENIFVELSDPVGMNIINVGLKIVYLIRQNLDRVRNEYSHRNGQRCSFFSID